MSLVEINFDGIVGPTHNYAGLSPGNIAATRNAGSTSHPRAAALQGVAKMRAALDLGLTQGIFPPHPRPNAPWLAALGIDADRAGQLWAAATSASPMWAANAATVSPAPDTGDGRCHLTAANLMTMPHRSHEWPATLAQLRLAFADERHFAVHPPVPAPFGDEGAANHMRICERHGEPGLEIFVHGQAGGPFPARQHPEASMAIARRHGVDALHISQSPAAIAAGAFHNDVVAVANENVLLVHEQAFADREAVYASIRERMPSVEIIEVPASAVSLDDAIASYLFNAQLVTLPGGGMALILPSEAQAVASVDRWLQTLIAGNGAIRRLLPVNVRGSMANGGGPACLRLRVVCDPATVDPRFLVDHPRLDLIADVIERHWPETVTPADHARLGRWQAAADARSALLEALNLGELLTASN